MDDRNQTKESVINEVIWQMASWVLLPLAVGIMTQPSGKVLALNDKKKFDSTSAHHLAYADSTSFISSPLFFSASLNMRVFWKVMMLLARVCRVSAGSVTFNAPKWSETDLVNHYVDMAGVFVHYGMQIHFFTVGLTLEYDMEAAICPLSSLFQR